MFPFEAMEFLHQFLFDVCFLSAYAVEVLIIGRLVSKYLLS